MPTGIAGRVMKGLAASGYSQVVNLLIQVVSVPVFLTYWGKDRWGEWLLLSTIPTYLSISNISLASAAGNDMTMRVSKGDREGAIGVFQSTWLAVTLLSATLLAIAIGLVMNLPIERWLNLHSVGHAEAAIVGALLLTQVAIAQQIGVLHAGFRCDGNYHAGIATAVSIRLVEFLAGMSVLVAGGGMKEFALAVIAVDVPGALVMALILRRRSSWLTFGWAGARWAEVKALLGPAVSFNAFPIGNALSLQGIVTVIGVSLGPGAVATFSLMRTVTRVINQITNAVGGVFGVELSRAMGAGDLGLARSLHRRACQISLWIALSLAGVLAVAGGPIIAAFGRGRVEYDFRLFGLLLIVLCLNSLWTASGALPQSVNRHQRFALAFLIVNGLAVAVAAGLVGRFGLVSAAGVLIAVEVAMALIVLSISLRMISEPAGVFWRCVFTPPVSWIFGRLRRGEASS